MSIQVSVVMPIYNEEKYIDKCIQSLLMQDYPRERMEWIFVDGMSTDSTRHRLETYRQQYSDVVRLLDNPNKTASCAMNVGIATAVGRYIVRLDAHSCYAPDYISKCIYYLEETGAENVGGILQTKAEGFVGGAISKMLSSKFGVGNSQFRTGGESGYVDTVPFGAFRREVFTKYGGYDERLTRNEDNELNYRIRKNGGNVYQSQKIRLSYYCRDSIQGIARMAFQNGMWNIISMKLCPGAMGVRHFVPFAFVLSILVLSFMGMVHPVFLYGLCVEIGMYLTLDMLFSGRMAESKKEFVLLLILFPIFHITYGCGSVFGICKACMKEYRASNYMPPRL